MDANDLAMVEYNDRPVTKVKSHHEDAVFTANRGHSRHLSQSHVERNYTGNDKDFDSGKFQLN